MSNDKFTNIDLQPSWLLKEEAFELLTQIQPDLVLQMMRNQYRLTGPVSGNSRVMTSVLKWLGANANGFVYIMEKKTKGNNKAKPTKYDYSILFEDKADATTFKLMFF